MPYWYRLVYCSSMFRQAKSAPEFVKCVILEADIIWVLYI